MKKVVSLAEAKASAERKRYAALVLGVFDDFKHSDSRQQKEKTSEVRRDARSKL